MQNKRHNFIKPNIDSQKNVDKYLLIVSDDLKEKNLEKNKDKKEGKKCKKNSKKSNDIIKNNNKIIINNSLDLEQLKAINNFIYYNKNDDILLKEYILLL